MIMTNNVLANTEKTNTMVLLPALRTEVLLNGDWPEGGQVPRYEGERLERKTYRRSVQVPADWTDRRVMIEFDGIAYSANIYVNDRLVKEHVGAWLPLRVDITSLISAGQTFELRVEVAGMLQEPTLVNGWERWPLGSQQLTGNFGGIVGDVYLRAYGLIHVADTFIRPSVRQQHLELWATVVNTTDQPQSIQLVSHVIDGADQTALMLQSPPVALQPGEEQQVRYQAPWTNARLWWPDDPHLYLLQTQILRDGQVLDTETRRFGFREFWIEGTQYRLNGIRVNLRGDYCGFGGYWPMTYQTRENLANTYRLLKDRLNFNVLRWHMRPGPRYVYDIADEVGMMIVAESAVYGRPSGPMPAQIKQTYIANCQTWIAQWIPNLRNHPCIVQWSPVNEMGPKYTHHQALTSDELKSIGAVNRRLDDTRPLIYHGNPETVEDTQNHHYPMQGNWAPMVGSIYSWRSLLHPDVPTGVGEFLQTSATTPHPRMIKSEKIALAERNKWWLGTIPRGLRYVGFADFRPKMFFWMHRELDSHRSRNAINAFAPVALFDIEYDDAGIIPLVDKIYPSLQTGIMHRRRLALYNDTYRNTTITVEIELRHEGQSLAITRRSYEVPLGYRVDIPLSMNIAGGRYEQVDMIRRTFKNDTLHFEESTIFQVRGQAEGDTLLELGDNGQPQ